MKVILESAFPDGLTVTFDKKFFFHTWDEAFAFIRKVDALYHTSPQTADKEAL